MKELSIEDKAKRYGEALERAKSKIRNDKDHVLYEDDVIEIFPELKESEDEQIRKEIIKLVKFYYGSSLVCKHTISKDKMLAWLEKQGENFTKRDIDDVYLKGISDCKHEMDKQKKEIKEEADNDTDFFLSQLDQVIAICNTLKGAIIVESKQ